VSIRLLKHEFEALELIPGRFDLMTISSRFKLGTKVLILKKTLKFGFEQTKTH
jgi:hypothetical protein